MQKRYDKEARYRVVTCDIMGNVTAVLAQAGIL